MPVNGAAGSASVQEELSPEALLVATGETIIAEGGFAGKKALRRKCATELRLIAQSATAPKEQNPVEAVQETSGKETIPEDVPSEGPPAEETPFEKAAPPSPPESSEPEAPEPEPPRPPPEEASVRRAPQPYPTVLAEILQRAHALFAPLAASNAQSEDAAAPEATPAPPPEPRFCPFTDFYPDADWKKVPYPGAQRCYLEGIAQTECGRLLLHGIPGEYSPLPPVPGFKRFLRDRNGCGYWIRIRKM